MGGALSSRTTLFPERSDWAVPRNKVPKEDGREYMPWLLDLREVFGLLALLASSQGTDNTELLFFVSVL